ncbi:MAG: hypothetical protein HY908_17480, partial [Myxococcales bacterium]|nr:hypothetical protein [Myxococcales bacterium]
MAKRTKSVTVATSGPASEPRLRGAAGLLPGTVEKGDAGDAGAYELRL